MNPLEATKVLDKVLAYCPAQSMTENTPRAWAEGLDDIRFPDALEAVRRLGRRDADPGESLFIEPRHIRKEVFKMRAERRAAHPHVEPPSGLDPGQLLLWMRETDERIANGERVESPKVEARPMPELGSLLKSVNDAL